MPNRVITVNDKQGNVSQIRLGEIARVIKNDEDSWKVELNLGASIYVDDDTAKTLLKKISHLA